MNCQFYRIPSREGRERLANWVFFLVLFVILLFDLSDVDIVVPAVPRVVYAEDPVANVLWCYGLLLRSARLSGS